MESFEFYSQVGQDRYVFETFFRDKKNGVFLDIGAHDGIDKSNTYFFEKTLGWTGICVEPIPEVFERLKNNRKCICVNAGVSDKSGKATFWKIEGYSEMLSGLEENYNEQHKERIRREIDQHGGRLTEMEIEIKDINSLLEMHNIRQVDYCSIDVEGSEEKLLSVLDPERVDIQVFTVENNYRSESLRKLMRSKGYKLHSEIEFDDVYVKEVKTGFFRRFFK